MVTRTRPRQHTRRCKSGKRILVNRGVFSRPAFVYKIARTKVNNKRSDNIHSKNESDFLKEKLKGTKTIAEQQEIIDKLSDIKRRVAQNNEDIDHINKKYFPKNPG